MTPARYFFVVAAITMLAIMVAGFHPYWRRHGLPARRLRLHMKLGWGGVAVALVAAGSGFMLAVESVRPVPSIPFWGMAYRQFLRSC